MKRSTFIRENAYRDAWLLVITALTLFALGLALTQVDEVREGRKTGTALTCTITSAILEGGHDLITAPATASVPPKLERSLEAQGYPPKAVREKATQAQADSYTAAVQNRVEHVKGIDGRARGLIAPSGKLDCNKLAALTKAR